MPRVGLNRDVGDEEGVGSHQTLVTLVSDSEVKSGAFAQGFDYPGKIFSTDGRLVISKRDDQLFVSALAYPFPVVEPRERKPLGGTVGLGENNAAVVIVGGVALQLPLERRPGSIVSDRARRLRF